MGQRSAHHWSRRRRANSLMIAELNMRVWLGGWCMCGSGNLFFCVLGPDNGLTPETQWMESIWRGRNTMWRGPQTIELYRSEHFDCSQCYACICSVRIWAQRIEALARSSSSDTGLCTLKPKFSGPLICTSLRNRACIALNMRYVHSDQSFQGLSYAHLFEA